MSDSNSNVLSPLPIRTILQEAIQLSWAHRKHFGILLVIPSLLLAGSRFLQDIWIFQDDQSAISWSKLAYLAIISSPLVVAFGIFAIACHRSILLTPHGIPALGYLGWSARETRFVLYSILLSSLTWLAIGVCFSFSLLTLVFLTVIFSSWLSTIAAWKDWDWVAPASLTFFLAIFLVAYPIGRLSLVLPAIAVDRKVSARWSWVISEPYDWQLAFLVGVLPFGSAVLQTAFTTLLPNIIPDTLQYLLEGFLYSTLLVMEIAILSLSYRTVSTRNPESSHSTLPTTEMS
jgi:hypothetical protein